jgi:hypothetical protein
MHFLTVYYYTPQLLHVSTHARNHQGAFLFLLQQTDTINLHSAGIEKLPHNDAMRR